MIFKIDSNLNEVIGNVKGAILLKSKPSDAKWNLLYRDELIGNIGENYLWLQKTRPHMNRSPQRFFEGKITDHNNYVIIDGRFKFTKGSKIFFLLSMYLFSILFCSPLNQFLYKSDGLKIMSLLIIWLISMFLTFGSGVLLFRKEEKEVTDFLNKLGSHRNAPRF